MSFANKQETWNKFLSLHIKIPPKFLNNLMNMEYLQLHTPLIFTILVTFTNILFNALLVQNYKPYKKKMHIRNQIII